MPATAAATMAALQEKCGRENRPAQLIEVIVFGFDRLLRGSFHARRRRLTKPRQAIPAKAGALRARFCQLTLHLDGDGECLAPTRPFVSAAIGHAAVILTSAHRTPLLARRHSTGAVSKSIPFWASAKFWPLPRDGDSAVPRTVG